MKIRPKEHKVSICIATAIEKQRYNKKNKETSLEKKKGSEF